MITSINAVHTLPQTVHGIAARIVSLFSTEDKKIVGEVIDRKEMIQFHHTAGMTIRNVYGLWTDHPLTEQWRQDQKACNTTHIIDGVDHHPNHPDAVSMQILYEVWDIVHNA